MEREPGYVVQSVLAFIGVRVMTVCVWTHWVGDDGWIELVANWAPTYDTEMGRIDFSIMKSHLG